MDSFVKRRLSGLFGYILWSSVIGLQLGAARKLFDIIPGDYQWILAIAIVVLKEINDRIVDKFITMSAAPEDTIHTSLSSMDGLTNLKRNIASL